MTIPDSWGYAKLQDELDLAVRSVRLLESQIANGVPDETTVSISRPRILKPRAERLEDWREYEDRLRGRMTVVGLNAELDAIGAPK